MDQKNHALSRASKRSLIEVNHPALSVRRQRELLGLNRSSLYYEPTGETAENLRLMRLIDEQYTARPFHGGRRMTAWLIDRGEEANRKRVRRLMRIMGLEAIYPKPRLSQPVEGHRIYPCLLRSVTVERPDLVWSADITYVPMASGFMYLTAVIDWYSRYVVAWRLSDTLDGSFRLEMLEEALRGGGRNLVSETWCQFSYCSSRLPRNLVSRNLVSVQLLLLSTSEKPGVSSVIAPLDFRLGAIHPMGPRTSRH